MRNFFIITVLVLISIPLQAGLLYCEFTVYGVAPFIETQNEFTDGVLGSEVAVTHQGKTQNYPLVVLEVKTGEKLKFTIADGNPEGEIYVTVFEDAGSVDGSFKSMVSNPAITIPALKDVPGYCLIEQ